MGKHLTITYGDAVLYDDEPDEFTWQESKGAIALKAGPAQPSMAERWAAKQRKPARSQLLQATPTKSVNGEQVPGQ